MVISILTVSPLSNNNSGNVAASLLQTAVTSYLFFISNFTIDQGRKDATMNNEYPVFLRKDEWDDIIDFIGITSFDNKQTDELQAYGIQLIESIKEQVYES